MRLSSAALCVAGLLTIQQPAAAACRYAQIDPGHPPATGDASFDFGAADDPAHPTAWQGPIGIARPQARCTVDPDVSIVERPVFTDGQRLLVTTYSGSNRVVFAVDTASCRVLWHSRKFDGAVLLHGDTLHLGRMSLKFDRRCVP